MGTSDRKPVIGLTCDTVNGHTPTQWKYESPHAYCRAVVRAGGVPFLLPYEESMIGEYLRVCDGFLLTGGDDPDMTRYGIDLHPETRLMHAARQSFEEALLVALDATRHPVLGICLGMQMMCLHAGGKLHPHMPDAPQIGPQKAEAHKRVDHPVQRLNEATRYLPRDGVVHSRHHQAVTCVGSLEKLAEHEGVIEAAARPGGERYYLGVQWHPEITSDEELGLGVIRRFVEACVRS